MNGILRRKLLAKGRPPLNFHEREIWWCSFGVNVGSEQDGVGMHFERPGLIVKRLSTSTCVILPLSTKKKLPRFQEEITFKGVTNFALLDQIRVIDTSRLRRKIGYLAPEKFLVIKERICELLR